MQTLADVLHLKFSRIQFTPDLMPGDIIGTTIVRENDAGRKFMEFQPGPIFANLVLADEINRATPKTQSALLEAMQENSVSAGGQTHPLQQPFFVLATMNPLEMEGTYPLPEAQLDRFFFKLKLGFPSAEGLSEILDRTTTAARAAGRARARPGRDPGDARDRALGPGGAAGAGLRHPPDARHASGERARDRDDQALRALRLQPARHPGADPGRQGATRCSTIACTSRRGHPQRSRSNALRHRLLLNFDAEAERVDADAILEDILQRVPAPYQLQRARER